MNNLSRVNNYEGFYIKSLQKVEYKGTRYSPSGAGKAIITADAVNGWTFWKYVDSDGKEKEIDNLRKG